MSLPPDVARELSVVGYLTASGLGAIGLPDRAADEQLRHELYTAEYLHLVAEGARLNARGVLFTEWGAWTVPSYALAELQALIEELDG